MTDYIKREDAIKAFDPRQRRDWYTPWIVETLEGLPSADVVPMERYKSMENTCVKLQKSLADVAPVVRCKDCKHWDKHSQYGYDNENGVYGNYCKLWTPEDDFYAVETPADGFCYNGERKDDD